MKVLEIGNVRAEPGSKAFGTIAAGNHPAGGPLEMPLIVVNGSGDGPVLWLNGCIHGDEPQGPLAIMMLVRELDPAKLKGAVVAVPVMNVPAFEASERGNPLDMFSYDMNRVYPGSANGRFTERLAWAHKEALAAHADMEISIHSGGDHSFLDKTIFAAPGDAALELAQAMGKGWSVILQLAASQGQPDGRTARPGQARHQHRAGRHLPHHARCVPRRWPRDGRRVLERAPSLRHG